MLLATWQPEVVETPVTEDKVHIPLTNVIDRGNLITILESFGIECLGRRSI